MSVRELIAKVRGEVINGGLSPMRAGVLGAQLSGLLSHTLDEVRAAEMAYNAVLDRCFEECGKANRAEIKAKLSPEYERLRAAEDAAKSVESMERSLRKLQDTAIVEMRMR